MTKQSKQEAYLARLQSVLERASALGATIAARVGTLVVTLEVKEHGLSEDYYVYLTYSVDAEERLAALEWEVCLGEAASPVCQARCAALAKLTKDERKLLGL
jgi:hypothetical protein